VGCSRLRVVMVVSRVGMVVILMGVGVMGLWGACFDFSDRWGMGWILGRLG
jgi:low affinity Fe/Cu permease